MAKARKIRRVVNIKDQKEFPQACTGALWRSKIQRKSKNKGKK